MERMATRGFGRKKIAAALGVPVAEAALRRRHGVAQHRATAWCGVWCVRHVFFTCFVSQSLGVSSVSLVCGSMAVMRSAVVPQRSSTPGFLLTHAAQSPVFANVWHRAQPPQRPWVHGGGALASEAGDAHRCWSGSAKRRGCGKYLARHADSVVIVLYEYMAPNCTALMGLGVIFYGSWTARRRTPAGLLVSTTAQFCTAQSSFNHRVPQICLP